jgi:phosphoribosylglycinamide formyltransferase-1
MNASNEQRPGPSAHSGAQRWQPIDEFVAVPMLSFSRIAFFSSHGGSGSRGVIAACGHELQASPAIIISNNPDSAVISFAKDAGITYEVINVKICGSEAGVQERILERLQELGVDLIILSGYMKKLGPEIVAHYSGRIFNIHPALLPKYGGQGMYGMNVHRAVIEAKEVETGITIHQVDSNYDEGPIVARLRIPVDPSDTADMLAEKVKNEEPPFLVRTLMEMQRLKTMGVSTSEQKSERATEKISLTGPRS